MLLLGYSDHSRVTDMIRRRLLVLLLCSALFPVLVQGDGRTVFGISQQLADGAMAIRSGRYSEGLRLTHRGLAFEISKGQRAAAYSNLCAGHAGLQQYPEAVAHCDTALTLEPRRWQAYSNRALAYLGMGKLDLASQDVGNGLAINPDSATLQRVQQLIDRRLAAPAGSTGNRQFL